MFLFSWGRKWSTLENTRKLSLVLVISSQGKWWIIRKGIWAGLFWGSLFSCSGLVTTILRSFQLSRISQANCSLITKGWFFGSDIWCAISIGGPLRPCILFLPLSLLGWLCYLVIVPLTLDHRSGCCCLTSCESRDHVYAAWAVLPGYCSFWHLASGAAAANPARGVSIAAS